MSSPSPPLSAGMFLMPVHDPKKPLAQCYDEDIELVLNCEEFGLKEFWCGEHHSSVVENIVMPEIFIAKALGMTKTFAWAPHLSACSTTIRCTLPVDSHFSTISRTDA